MEKKLSKRFWGALLLFSLIGQVAWVVENMYFNVFIYKIFAATPSDISLMVAASAISATLTTVFIGALSDRIGKRKLFISGGYILWGISILSFSLIRVDVIDALFPAVASAAGVGVTLVIVMDIVMTFFGSSANDAAFNAWLTDMTNEKNRGAAEGLNAMMPLVAILAVFGGFMSFNLELAESWTTIFLMIGVVVILIGIAGLFLIDEPPVEHKKEPYLGTVFYGFRPRTVRENRGLYLLLLLFILFNISIQIFMPYLIIYYEVSLAMTDYVLVMAPAVIVASAVTALWGRVYDKRGFRFSSTLSLLWLALGYLLLFLTRTKLPVFIGSCLMMSGYLSGMAVFGARIRDNTPEGKAGRLQGIRIFSQVLLPGVIGPYIGKLVLQNADTTVGGDGTVSFIPSADIFLAALVPAAILLLLVLFLFRKTPPRTVTLDTPFSPSEIPFSEEHPNPQMKRDTVTLLNGEWRLSIQKERGDSEEYGIRVPYPPESALSGVGRVTKKGETLVYTRAFSYTKQEGKQLFLRFGAVDQSASVEVNGIAVGCHTGGYTPFSFDITEACVSGENRVTVRVADPLDRTLPYGKQTHKRGGMWYTPVSGIWQSVYLEEVPCVHIERLRLTPRLDAVTIEVTGGEEEKTLTVGDESYTFTGDSFTYTPKEPHLWTPEDPFLYDFTIESGEDRVSSYFALREIGVAKPGDTPTLTLNGSPYFFHGLLDQGYFPDGIYTPASAEGYKSDILAMKSLGFNMLRKHIKLEPQLFYYYCDKYGMAVFQDMVNCGRYSFFYDTVLPTLGLKRLPKRQPPAVYQAFISSAKDLQDALYNHPSVVYYTIYNEGWGQSREEESYDTLKARDKTRIYDTTSGWFGKHKSDVESEHIYFKKLALPISEERPTVLSEFGGYSYNVEGHVMNLDRVYGYKLCKSARELADDLCTLYLTEVLPLVRRGLSAAVLTQVSDVEDETNGILTYDRRVVKPDPDAMRAVAAQLFAAFDAFRKEK